MELSGRQGDEVSIQVWERVLSCLAYRPHSSQPTSLPSSLWGLNGSLLSVPGTRGSRICDGRTVLVHGSSLQDAQPGPRWRCPQTEVRALSPGRLQYLAPGLAAGLALSGAVEWMTH